MLIDTEVNNSMHIMGNISSLPVFGILQSCSRQPVENTHVDWGLVQNPHPLGTHILSCYYLKQHFEEN